MANTAAVVVVLKLSTSLVCYQTTRQTVDFGNGRTHLAPKCVTLVIFLKRLAVRVSIRPKQLPFPVGHHHFETTIFCSTKKHQGERFISFFRLYYRGGN